jgi:hypothetical protein
MSDPMTGGAAKVAEEMLKEVQSAMKEAERLAEQQKTPNIQFQQTLDAQQTGQLAQSQRVGQVDPTHRALDRLREAIQAQRVPQAPAAGSANDTRPSMSGMQRIFEDVMSGQNKLEEIIDLAISGRNFSQSELLALQAGVYRFTQELELTSKVIEKGTSSIKQTLNTQV